MAPNRVYRHEPHTARAVSPSPEVAHFRELSRPPSGGVVGGSENSPEEWRDVPGLEGRYRVSSLGRCIGPSGRTIGAPDKDGYIIVGFVGDPGRTRTTRIHSWVAAAFLGPCPDGKEVDHIDDVRWNNRPTNLRYVSHSENMERRSRHGDRSRFKAAAEAAGSYDRKLCGGCRQKGHNVRTCPRELTALAADVTNEAQQRGTARS